MFDAFATPWTVAHQDLLSMGFPRQEYWSGLPFPSPGESSLPRDRTCVSCTGRHILNHWTTRKAPLIQHHKLNIPIIWVVPPRNFLRLGGAVGQESTCQCRRHKRCEFNPRVRKIPLEKETATHSSMLVWEIPRTEESGRLQFMGSQRARHGWVSEWLSLHAAAGKDWVLCSEYASQCLWGGELWENCSTSSWKFYFNYNCYHWVSNMCDMPLEVVDPSPPQTSTAVTRQIRKRQLLSVF